MTTAVAAVPLIGRLILVRLLAAGPKGMSPKILLESLNQLLPYIPTTEEWQAYRAELVAAGLLEKRACRLTDAGRAEALAFLGVDTLPARTKWETVKTRYLLPLALGVPPDNTAQRERLADSKQLPGYLLKQHFEVSLTGPFSLSKVLEALACQQVCGKLGLPLQTTLEGLRRVVLSQLIGAPKTLTKKDLEQQVPSQVLGGRGNGPKGLRDAVLARWLGQTSNEKLAPVQEPTASTPLTPALPSKADDLDLPAFANAVIAVARHSRTGRFGDNKVFINHVWRQWCQEPNFPGLELSAFKRRLIEASQANLLHLSRADLPQLVDAGDVQESEIQHQGTTFHFLFLP